MATKVVASALLELRTPSGGLLSGRKASPPAVLQALASQLYRWDLDIFAVDRATGRKPLAAVATALFTDLGLFDNWLLDRKTVERYLAAAEEGYRSNPYHNSLHAADVCQGTGVILQSVDANLSDPSTPAAAAAPSPPAAAAAPAAGPAAAATQPLSKLEKFALVFAAAVHDLGHPGYNNDFLKRSRDQMAVIYNDRSINENMHLARAFELALCREGCNIFARFSEEEYKQARDLIVAMVLATDMAQHAELFAQWQAAIAACPDVRQWRGKERTLLLQMSLHLADISNPARPWLLASPWGERIVVESVAQGEEEAARGMAVTPFCDGRLVNLPGAQIGFIRMFAEPTLNAFAAAAPAFVAVAAPCMAETRARWEFLLEAGVRAPCQGSYPVFTEQALTTAAAQRARAEADTEARLQQLAAVRSNYWQQQQQQQQQQR